MITPVLLDTSRQAKAQEGFAAHDFTIDWDNQQAVCPAGKTSTTWNDVVQEGVAKTVVSFAALDCIPCPSKDQCTSARSHRRRLSLQPRELT
ncbi:transposase, partial [Streptomyces sp. NPDC001982]